MLRRSILSRTSSLEVDAPAAPCVRGSPCQTAADATALPHRLAASLNAHTPSPRSPSTVKRCGRASLVGSPAARSWIAAELLRPQVMSVMPGAALTLPVTWTGRSQGARCHGWALARPSTESAIRRTTEDIRCAPVGGPRPRRALRKPRGDGHRDPVQHRMAQRGRDVVTGIIGWRRPCRSR